MTKKSLDVVGDIARFALSSKGCYDAAIKFLEKDIDRWKIEQNERCIKERRFPNKKFNPKREDDMIRDLAAAIAKLQSDKRVNDKKTEN